jgi:putative transcriptional regulator
MADEERDSLRGRLLIAGPTLLDPNFARSVVLIAEHGDQGAMGVILNRPATVAATDAVPDLAALVDPSEPVYVGGPVQQQSVIVLADFEDESFAGQMILGSIGFVTAGVEFDELAAAVRRVRIFAGCAGWAPGQLEAEIERDDWIVGDAEEGDFFGDEVEELWSGVLMRMGGNYALLATMPVDPSVN